MTNESATANVRFGDPYVEVSTVTAARRRDPLEVLRAQVVVLEQEIAQLRRKLADAPKRMRALEERLLETKGQLAHAVSQNEKLSYTLREAREHIASLRDEVDKLTQPPSAYGVVVGKNDDGTVDVLTSGRKMRVSLHPDIDHDDARARRRGRAQRELQRDPRPHGRGHRRGRHHQGADGRRRPRPGRRPGRRGARLRAGRRAARRAPAQRRHDAAGPAHAACCSRSCPVPRSRTCCSKRCPTSPTPTSAASTIQIEQIADAVELPFLYQELFAEHRLPAPKGILLYGPPGCGKTLIAKAVANSLAKKVAAKTGGEKGRSYFINIKGPELLNKYVGETERQIRLVFQRARREERGGLAGHRLLRRDGLACSAPAARASAPTWSRTIVPQLLAEIDGVEGLRNVIVIGATNREDLIDPAILRPGRLDVKIKIERPNADAARADLRPVPHRRDPDQPRGEPCRR